jgi:hypothetical protein
MVTFLASWEFLRRMTMEYKLPCRFCKTMIDKNSLFCPYCGCDSPFEGDGNGEGQEIECAPHGEKYKNTIKRKGVEL